MYRPLPAFLVIKPSSIEGRGIITSIELTKGISLGLSHIYDEEFPDNLIRTPLGGFLNHSKDPNCEKAKLRFSYYPEDKQPGYIFNKWNLVTIKNIKEGEELTLTYTFYKIND